MHGPAATGGCDKSHLAWRQAPRQRANSQAVARRPSSRRPRPVLSPAARRSQARRRAVRRRQAVAALTLVILVIAVAMALAAGGNSPPRRAASSPGPSSGAVPAPRHNAGGSRGPLNVYAADAAANISPVAKNDPALVYVPNSMSDTVSVISQRTLKVLRTFSTGGLPQHVTPAWNLKTLYVDNDDGNSLTPINPRTAQPGRPIAVEDPYNMY